MMENIPTLLATVSRKVAYYHLLINSQYPSTELSIWQMPPMAGAIIIMAMVCHNLPLSQHIMDKATMQMEYYCSFICPSDHHSRCISNKYIMMTAAT